MEPEWTGDLERWICNKAVEAGFDLCRVAALQGVQERLAGERFAAWVDAGRAGGDGVFKAAG